MAVQAKWRDDISGAIVTGGTSTSYTVATYTVFDSLAHMGGQVVAFTPHATNGATVTLNVDGLGAKPLRSAPSVELLAGTLIQGTPYTALYNNSDAVWYLSNFYVNPYNVPLAAGIDYWGTTSPNSAFAFATGQALSRTTYANLFAIWGTTYGVGDGSTTFNMPNKTGRVSAMVESIATRLTSTYFGGNSTVLGSVGGLESHTLTTAQLASHSHSNTLNDSGHAHLVFNYPSAGGVQYPASGSRDGVAGGANGSTATNTTGISINNASAGSGNAHNNVQPTIICNYIIRII
ncbi:phage tail protein [Bradyrhizobium sp. AZCC 1610]|uniref:phage tail protein n=1 Tax=Bradyrhizobium sp. AZCC 1610 TaxID=3117020 RepID=UPI002FEF7261